MKTLFAVLLMTALPTLAVAQATAKPAASKASAPAKASSSAKPAAAAKPAATPAKHKPAPSKSRTEIKTTAKNMAAGIEAAEAALTPAELAVAGQVQTGFMPCELGNSVTVEADPKSPGYFNLSLQKLKFRMFPVVSSTGAVRLEDHKAGAVWLQLGNKSMLMDQTHGKRLADECVSTQQAQFAEAMKGRPAQNLLDPLPATPPAAAVSAPAAPASR